MLIRTATPADRSAIARVHAASWRDAYAPFLPAGRLGPSLDVDLANQWETTDVGPPNLVLVAEDAELAGFILVLGQAEPYIDSLHVEPSRRSQGIGHRLLDAAFHELTAQGKQTASLSVVADNVDAIRFYRRLGAVVGRSRSELLRGHPVTYTEIAWRSLADLPRLTVR